MASETNSATGDSREVDLVDFAAILLRRSKLVMIIWLLFVVLVAALASIPMAGTRTVEGAMGLGAIPEPQSVVQPGLVMPMRLYDRPPILEKVLSVKTVAIYYMDVAVPNAITQLSEWKSSTIPMSNFEVETAGSVVVFTISVIPANEKYAKEILALSMAELGAYCNNLTAARIEWLKAGLKSPEGGGIAELAEAFDSLVPKTTILRPAEIVVREYRPFSIATIGAFGLLGGLAFAVFFVLMVELASRGSDRNRMATSSR